MSDLMNLEEARRTLRLLTIVAVDANRVLFDGLQHPDSQPSPERQVIFNRILENLSPMREGFMLTLRTSDVALASELRALIDYLIDWSWLADVGLRWNTEAEIEHLGGQVVLYQHALIAFAMMPRLPSNAITYPYGAYTDIPVPTTPGETLTRLEELENTIWTASTEPVSAVSRGALRRTYGFFEATTWLIANHLKGVIGW